LLQRFKQEFCLLRRGLKFDFPSKCHLSSYITRGTYLFLRLIFDFSTVEGRHSSAGTSPAVSCRQTR
jgi:hypothetical protein